MRASWGPERNDKCDVVQDDVIIGSSVMSQELSQTWSQIGFAMQVLIEALSACLRNSVTNCIVASDSETVSRYACYISKHLVLHSFLDHDNCSGHWRQAMCTYLFAQCGMKRALIPGMLQHITAEQLAHSCESNYLEIGVTVGMLTLELVILHTRHVNYLNPNPRKIAVGARYHCLSLSASVQSPPALLIRSPSYIQCAYRRACLIGSDHNLITAQFVTFVTDWESELQCWSHGLEGT